MNTAQELFHEVEAALQGVNARIELLHEEQIQIESRRVARLSQLRDLRRECAILEAKPSTDETQQQLATLRKQMAKLEHAEEPAAQECERVLDELYSTRDDLQFEADRLHAEIGSETLLQIEAELAEHVSRAAEARTALLAAEAEEQAYRASIRGRLAGWPELRLDACKLSPAKDAPSATAQVLEAYIHYLDMLEQHSDEVARVVAGQNLAAALALDASELDLLFSQASRSSIRSKGETVKAMRRAV